MIRAYDEMYVEGAMIRMGDMLEYACLDCGYDPDGFWKMFIHSGLSRRFEIGDVSVIAGKSGPELAYMVLYDVDHRRNFPKPAWREDRSDLYWSGWVLAYFQWHENLTFTEVWNSISIRMLRKMYPTLHEADIAKAVDAMAGMMKPVSKSTVKSLRLIRGLTQQELADRAHMTVSQLQRIEYEERKIENLSLKTAIALSKALGVGIEELA
ncbi:MAG: helix-turn-helix transcriptional regulator [Acetatifactor sp.]|nr:helix-turn-helix transcriptional regulator [Acetatifactor sp.]